MNFADLAGEWSPPKVGDSFYIQGCKVKITEDGLDIDGTEEEKAEIKGFLSSLRKYMEAE